MSKTKRCDRCRGSKIVMGLGGMQHKCKVCSGLGYALKVDEEDEKEFLETKTQDKKIDKRSKEYRESLAK